MKQTVSVFNPLKDKFERIEGDKIANYSGFPFAITTITPTPGYKPGYLFDSIVCVIYSPSGENIQSISGRIDGEEKQKRFEKKMEDMVRTFKKTCYSI